MRIILTVEMSDERLKAEGVSPEEIQETFEALRKELSEETPDGAIVTLRIEPGEHRAGAPHEARGARALP